MPTSSKHTRLTQLVDAGVVADRAARGGAKAGQDLWGE